MASFSSMRQAPYRLRRDEDGYALLTLLLVVALMAIAATAILPAMSYQIRRDREEEMIHRGVQYTRAIRAYFKKFGRYPTRLEDLDNTSNQRFLRKHYKDPLNKNKVFRLLHYGEQGVTLGGGIVGGGIAGANPIGSSGGLSSPGGFSQPSAFGSNQNSLFGSSPNSSFGGSSNSSTGFNPSGTNSPGSTNQSQSSSSSSSTSQDSSSAQVNAKDASDQSSSSQPVIGGPIVGVTSYSKESGFREFNHKKKYNEWQFVYDPATDRGGLITTPNQPALALPGFGNQQQLNGAQPASPNGSSFGNSNGSSFGQSSGFGNQNSSQAPPQPPSPPQPQ